MDAQGALAVFRQQLKRTSQRRLADAIGVSEATVSRWKGGGASPEGEQLERLIAWAEKQPPTQRELPAPAVPSDYWRGVFYAAEAMSETVTRLLREGRESNEETEYRVKAAAMRLVAESAPTAPSTPPAPRPDTDSAALRTEPPQGKATTAKPSGRPPETR